MPEVQAPNPQARKRGEEVSILRFHRMGESDPVQAGQGKGYKCPNCHNQTFQPVAEMADGVRILRCSKCHYAGIGTI